MAREDVNVGTRPVNVLSLCSGVGGLELGVKLAIPRARSVCYVEREAYAQATLVARMEEASLDPAPIWDDLTTFAGEPWRGIVDIVAAGIPCQPYSVAGKRGGNEDQRALWPHLVRIVDECRPDFVFIENVPRFVSAGYFEPVRDALQGMAYRVEKALFLRAGSIGATHRRERVFILAHADGVRRRHESLAIDERPLQTAVKHHGAGMADANGIGQQSVRSGRLLDGESQRRSDADGRDDPRLGDTSSEGLEGWGVAGSDSGDERFAWPPGPEERDRWVEYLRVRPEAEPSICRGPHGLAEGLEFWADRLRVCGNGVVPIQEGFALLTLLREAGLI